MWDNMLWSGLFACKHQPSLTDLGYLNFPGIANLKNRSNWQYQLYTTLVGASPLRSSNSVTATEIETSDTHIQSVPNL